MKAAKRRRTKKAARRAVAPGASRRDEVGGLWTAAQVEEAVFRIVVDLDSNAAQGLARKTRFSADLGWDDWFKLSVIKPVKSRLHEALTATVVLDRVKTVGDLIDYVWSIMEVVA